MMSILPIRAPILSANPVTRYLPAGIDICRDLREAVRQVRQRIALALQRFALLSHFRVERGQRCRIGFLRQRFIGIRQISGQFRDGAVRSRQVVAQLCDGIGQSLHRCRISLFGHCGIGGCQPVFQLGCPV